MFKKSVPCIAVLSVLLFLALFGAVTAAQAQESPAAVISAPAQNGIAATTPLSFTAQYTTYLPVMLSNYQQLPAPDLRITNYDLEEEYVDVQNRDMIDYDLTGYTLADEANHTYDFPNGFILTSGMTVRIWSKSGTDDAMNLYWGVADVWNNSGDTAYLRTASGTLIHSLELFPRDTRLYDLQIIFSHNPSTGDLLHEFVDIYNKDNAEVDLSSYQLGTAAGITFTFPATFTLPKDASVRVWTITDTNDAANVYAARSAEMWSNAGDTASLHNIHGALVVSAEIAVQDYQIAALRIISSANPADDMDTPDISEDLDEFIDMVNPENHDVDMSGYTLSDEAGNTYEFPDGFTIAAGATVRVWTKTGDDDTANLYWDRTVPVWGNRGDTAFLKDASGNLVHSCPTVINWENS